MMHASGQLLLHTLLALPLEPNLHTHCSSHYTTQQPNSLKQLQPPQLNHFWLFMAVRISCWKAWRRSCSWDRLACFCASSADRSLQYRSMSPAHRAKERQHTCWHAAVA